MNAKRGVVTAAIVAALAAACEPEPTVITIDAFDLEELPIPSASDTAGWDKESDTQLQLWQGNDLVVLNDDPNQAHQGVVPPALYYVALHITNAFQVNELELWDVHWSPLPIFGQAAEQHAAAGTGRHTYYTSGTGYWVYAIVPGELYNVLMDLNAVGETPLFPRIVLLDQESRPTRAPVSLQYAELVADGFWYNGRAATEPVEEVAGAAEPLIGEITGRSPRTSSRAMRS